MIALTADGIYQDCPFTAIRLIDSGEEKREAYPAYTVYELGKMFGGGTVATDKLYTQVQRDLNRGLSFTIVFEPDYLAKHLFYSIANSFTSSQECVDRMDKVPYDESKIAYLSRSKTNQRK